MIQEEKVFMTLLNVLFLICTSRTANIFLQNSSCTELLVRVVTLTSSNYTVSEFFRILSVLRNLFKKKDLYSQAFKQYVYNLDSPGT